MKKSVSLSLVVFLALAVVGFVYAAWTEQLQIDGVVSAAELGLEFELLGHTESTDGLARVALDNTKRTITVSVENAVPDYTLTINYKYKNVGDLPISVGVPYLDPAPAAWLEVNVEEAGGSEYMGEGEVSAPYSLSLTCVGEPPTSSLTTTFTLKFDLTLAN